MLDGDGRYLGQEALVARFTDTGVARGDTAVAYCGAGVAASNIAFSSLLAGHAAVKVYDGSMMDWALDPAREIVTTDE